MKRELWLIWKEPVSRRRYKIGILTCLDNEYQFKYVNPELEDAKKVGFDFYPGFYDLNKVYKNDDMFSNISTRLPNKRRPDYLEILNSYNLEIDSSKFDILMATRGRLLTDNYEFVQPFDKLKLEFDVAGTRHCQDVKKCMNKININDKLLLELEPSNESDSNAIKVLLQKDGNIYHLGYVPRYYSCEIAKLLKDNIKYSAMIKSINFESEISDEDITAFVKIIFND